MDVFDEKIIIKNLYKHVEYLSVKIGERNLWKENSLDRAKEYINSILISNGYDIWNQTFKCYGREVSNIIAQKIGENEEVLIVGAHYDTVPGTPGADDNASAVSVVLELVRLFRKTTPKKTIHFVLFVNEEPPCFGSPNMGSMVYAKYIKEKKIPLAVMVSLEMVGYFSDNEIQDYPIPIMSLFYPKKANYIGVVGNFRSRKYVSIFKKGIRRYSQMPTQSLTAPEFFGGINLSDNYSFWHYGFCAIMITDTSFFRNKNYHQEGDTIETLNFDKMVELVKGIYHTILNMDN